jgi:predicted transcriptional regulator/DNA-binding XRE family transcriptional regulator
MKAFPKLETVLADNIMTIEKKAMLGHKVRRFRQDLNMSQKEMAEALEISSSYLNLIEHNQRPVTVPLLFRLGQAFEVDLKEFAEDEGPRLAAGVREVFSDPIFEGQHVRDQEIRELSEISPAAAQAVMHLYQAYSDLRADSQQLAERFTERDQPGAAESGAFPVEEVRDFYESRSNHFPELEAAAEELWEQAELNGGSLQDGLTRHLDSAFGVGVRIMPLEVMEDVLRRFEHHRRRVLLSEALPPSGRVFQLAMQIANFGQSERIDRIVAAAGFVSPEAERLCRHGLAGYFAAAVLMPYEPFLSAAQAVRYDIEILQHRFGASFEQICHRLTTLQRSGARGVPFFFVRLDHAGNVSKRLSAGGMQFARFGGTCPRWIVYDAFRVPGRIEAQLAQMPDGAAYLTVARTVSPVTGGFRRQRPALAVAVGCEATHARHVVYGDGLDTKNQAAMTPIGVSCRVCERPDCAFRAHPPINQRLKFDANIQRMTPYRLSG